MMSEDKCEYSHWYRGVGRRLCDHIGNAYLPFGVDCNGDKSWTEKPNTRCPLSLKKEKKR